MAYELSANRNIFTLTRLYERGGERARKGSRTDGRVVFMQDGETIRVLRGSLILTKDEIVRAVTHARPV